LSYFEYQHLDGEYELALPKRAAGASKNSMPTHAPFILTINGGSSSIKFALYQAGRSQRLLDGKVDRIGLGGANLAFHDPSAKPPITARRPGFLSSGLRSGRSSPPSPPSGIAWCMECGIPSRNR
jgi:hypothetical protein